MSFSSGTNGAIIEIISFSQMLIVFPSAEVKSNTLDR